MRAESQQKPPRQKFSPPKYVAGKVVGLDLNPTKHTFVLGWCSVGKSFVVVSFVWLRQKALTLALQASTPHRRLHSTVLQHTARQLV